MGTRDAAVAEAQAAFEIWRERTFDQRAVPLRALAAVLRERAEQYARLITLEMGKPISESLAELEKCAFMAKGVDDDRDPAALPSVGLQRPGADHASIAELKEADLVVAIGYDIDARCCSPGVVGTEKGTMKGRGNRARG